MKRLMAILLVLAMLLPAGALAAVRTLELGKSGEDVAAVQTALKNYGYYNGEVSGKYDVATATAVKSFQRANSLSVDGKVGAKTLACLNGGKVVDVKAVQSRLQELGYYDGKVDGNFGALSVSAVKAFQTANKIKPVNGALNTATLTALNGSTAVAKPQNTMVGGALSSGSFGAAVEVLQQDLKDTYYYYGKVDGIFGPEVTKALKAFQASTGLKVDGKYGAASYNALHNRGASIFNGGIPSRTLSSGAHGWDVLVLQQKLSSMNYSVFLTASYDAATMAAIKKLQAKNGLKEDGVFGADERRYMWPSAVDQQEQDAIRDELNQDENAYSTEFGRILKRGKQGSDVANAQMRLKAGNYLFGKADGIFGAETEAAVKKLQKDFGLAKVDGIIGYETWKVLRSFDIGNAEQEVVDPSKPSIGANTRKLYAGCKGTDVKRLQQDLISLGYLASGEDDGKFGSVTAAAVMAFQADNGLAVDGVAGTKTLNKINSLTAPQG